LKDQRLFQAIAYAGRCQEHGVIAKQPRRRSTQITERHYAQLGDATKRQTIERTLPSFCFVAGTVTPEVQSPVPVAVGRRKGRLLRVAHRLRIVRLHSQVMRHLLAGLLLFSLTAVAQTPKTADPFHAISFLAGTWQAVSQASTGTMADTSYTFRFELSNHLLTRYSGTPDCQPTMTNDCPRADLLYIFAGSPNDPLEALYLDREGRAIHFVVPVPQPGTVLFSSEAFNSAPRYRLVYSLRDGVLSSKFQVLMTGQVDWKSFSEWSGTKQ
jgi:hypothetical protein